MLAGLLRMVTGSVEFTAEGGFPERFINLCSIEGIPLNGLYCSGGILKGNTSIGGYKKMRTVAKKSGMRMKIKSKKGLPFFMRKNRKRVGVIAGAVIFAVITASLSTRIWSVEVEGNVLLSDEDIISVFEDLGVHIGVSKKSLDTREIQSAAARRMDKVMWTSLNIDGSTAVIEIREVTEPSEKISEGTPCNIVASGEGTVETVEAYTGKAEVKRGDGVRKGSLLVSGVIENKDGTVTIRGADAYVAALTEHKYSAAVPFEPVLQKTELLKKRYYLHILGLKIPLGIGFRKTDDTEIYVSERCLSARGKRLPAGILTKRYAENTGAKITLTEDTAVLAAYEKIIHEMGAELVNAEITDCIMKEKISDDGVQLSAAVNCRENIGRKLKIDFAETGDEQVPAAEQKKQ
ncbi:MAG: sporulation protein YqfD [Clostridiales bacterium]|nr:sporulation protein YqfD [Clostridiales bacterium]